MAFTEPASIEWVFPAHAGMSLLILASDPAVYRFPRSRGDEPLGITDFIGGRVFSPLTRG